MKKDKKADETVPIFTAVLCLLGGAVKIMKMLNHKYLICTLCGEKIQDDGLTNGHGCPALLRAEYTDKRFSPGPDSAGLFKFSKWLPVERILTGSSSPVTYKSEALGNKLGLEKLFITFSGYWEEKGALMETGTFKECEAYSVLARFPKNSGKTLVVASAGNTARAFIKVAGENGIPLLVVIPEGNLSSLWGCKKAPNVRVFAVAGNSDYSDAINLAALLCEQPDFVSEGGAKNVARRDGMGTVMLSAAAFIGDVPDFYFQAVGSGTGAIAAFEANIRLRDCGFTTKLARLRLSQNIPFIPIYNAWRAGSRNLPEQDEESAKKQIAEISAKVLSNRTPPYSITGGLYDALSATEGDMRAVTNAEIAEAQELFLKTEGCDICPESGAALASLIQAVRAGEVAETDSVMVNITGGGFEAIKARFGSDFLKADVTVECEDIYNGELDFHLK